MSLQRYQLAVVGAGSAGLASAAFAAELGASVVLVERHRLGGDRLGYRVPAVAVIRTARGWAAGTRRPDDGRDDFAGIFKHARRLRTEATAASGVESLRDLGVDVVFGEARFVAADAVEVEDRRLEFRRALIATGARTAAPRIPGLEDVTFLTPETLFELTALPRRFGVVGAGSRGCEMAQTFADLGSEVHLFAAGDRLLPGRDPDAAALVAEAMRSDGLQLHIESGALELRRRGDGVRVILPDGRPEVVVDELLLATGPAPNVEGLGLEAAGVEYDLSGVEVDRCLRTTNRRIFAAGGVVRPEGDRRDNVLEEGAWGVSPSGLAPDADARMAVRNALLFRRLERRRHTVPRTTYTRPEIARVGIGSREAAASGKSIRTLTVPLADADRGGLFGRDGPHRRGAGETTYRRGTNERFPRRGTTEGFLRLHLKRRGGEVLGGTLVAGRAAELIAPLAIAVNRKMRLGDFAEIPLPHPTRGEIYRRAAFVWRRRKARRKPPPLMSLWLRFTSRF